MSKESPTLNEVLSEFRTITNEMTALRHEMHIFKDTLESLVKIVRGNGAPSLLTTVALLDREIKHIISSLDDGKHKFQYLEDGFGTKLDILDTEFRLILKDLDGKVEKNREVTNKRIDETKKTKVVLLIAVISGLFSLSAALISLLK